MEALQRSAVSFRRQGSSGFVWDDKFLSGELNQLAEQHKEDRDRNRNSTSSKPPSDEKKEESATNSSSPPPPVDGLTIERSRSNGGRGFRTGKVSPAIEPPSPKVSACGFCSAFGKSKKTAARRRAAAPPKKTTGKRVG